MGLFDYGVVPGHEWQIHGESTVYTDNKWVTVNLVDVTAPNGERFKHHAVRLKHVASVAVINDRREVLMMWRHRFIPNIWVWELPGGIVDSHENPEVTAARETLEETGYAVSDLQLIATFSPTPGLVDTPHSMYVTRVFEKVADPSDAEEASTIEWIPLSEVRNLLAEQKIGGTGSVTALLAILAFDL